MYSFGWVSRAASSANSRVSSAMPMRPLDRKRRIPLLGSVAF
jgi:hypothetical protein